MISLLLLAAAVSQPVDIAPGVPGAAEPQLAFLRDGRAVCAFGTREALLIAVERPSKDGFESSRLIVRSPKLMVGMRRGPRVAVIGNRLVVSATVPHGDGANHAANLVSFASDDEGRTWSRPVRINDVPGCTPEGLHAMAAFGKGKLACVWLDNRTPGTKLMASISADGGSTWSTNRLVYESPDGSICECCHPTVIEDGAGGLFVLWRNALQGNRDMYWSRSSDGARFSSAEKLGSGFWALKACPMDGGMAATKPGGGFLTIWRREDELFLCEPGRPEQRLGRGMQPWIASNGKEAWAVWQEGKRGRLWLQKVGGDSPRLLAEQADDAVAIAAAGGGWMAAWKEPGAIRSIRW